MKLTCFHIDHNKRQCTVSFGLPFKFDGILNALPSEIDGKPVTVVGLTPYTVEKVIDIVYDRRIEARNVCSWYEGNEAMDKLQNYRVKPVAA